MSQPLSSSTAQPLFLQIQSAVKKGDFKHAEALREKLMADNPMALNEIIQSAELIDAAKAEGIDKDHLLVWNKLYETLSVEEKNCLFYSLKNAVIPKGKIILSLGGFNTRLFFIERGEVTIYLPKGEKNTVLARLGRGEIFGEYTFTNISLCSATVVSQTEVQVRYLESTTTDDWDTVQPGLQDKLVDFCIKYGRVDEIVTRKKQEKRTYTRYLVEGRVTATLLDKDGRKTTQSFRGALSDLSVAGTCFLIKCSKKSTARALLARHLALDFSFKPDDPKTAFSNTGKVVGVSFHLYNDYSVHVHFTNYLKEKYLQQINLERP